MPHTPKKTQIVLPRDFYSQLPSHILLDTNVFIETLVHPGVFKPFCEDLRRNDKVLVTIPAVKTELLIGSQSKQKIEEKIALIDDLIDVMLPSKDGVFDKVDQLVEKFGVEGKSATLTDLLLGAALVQYPSGLALLTKNTTDFPRSIFRLVTHITVYKHKSIESFGLYVWGNEE